MIAWTALFVVAAAAAFFFIARGRARAFDLGAAAAHSRATYHGLLAASYCAVPAAVVLLAWLTAQGGVIDRMIIANLPTDITQGRTQSELDLLVTQVRQLARGLAIFEADNPALQAAADRLKAWQTTGALAMFAVVASIGAFGGAIALAFSKSAFRARNAFERLLTGIMVACAVAAILTTLGIIVSLLYESWRFFEKVPLTEFLFGLKWEPQIAIRADQIAGAGAFGAVPVFLGTALIAFLAMCVAAPVGLFAAIYLSEYADVRVRAVIKPILEILAGVPTVVYGFFAILIVVPAMVAFVSTLDGALDGWLAPMGFESLLAISPQPALAAGLVMGIMIIPFISSLSDDALRAVPQSMRDGAFALGATRAETIAEVLIPAALPGIMGGVLLAVSRAIGETMIVVMAAGMIAQMTVNPLDSVTTTTVQIVSLLTGDTEFDNPKTLAAFALGLVLFFVTLILNVIALSIVRRYREQYE